VLLAVMLEWTVMDRDVRLWIDVLGPLRVRDAAGTDVTPAGMLQRRLLALLVLHRSRVVSADAAIDALWADQPPRDPVAALQNHLFRLRRSLPGGVIESVGADYRLAAHYIELDADRLVAVVYADEPVGARRRAALDEVLGRWRGPAYPEMADVDDGRAEAVRLEELRLRAIEMRAECRLAVGDTDGLAADLAALAEAEPLRERPRSLLMAALSATGRRVEALRVFDDFRRLLSDELGIAPSPALAGQHADLLAGTAPADWAPDQQLPLAVTSLVGRDALVTEVAALAEAHRLVTLVGPGGVGKTRLVIEVGEQLRAARPARPVVLCELATATAESAIDVVAAALGIDARPGVALVDRVATVIGDRAIVVLIDNCEHVLDAVAELAGLVLARCVNLRLVATSRERLRVPGEQLCTVPPLLVGGDDAPAVRLFVERAQAVAPSFEPSPADLACVSTIVRRLDGLPLAIELAAARLHTHDVGEVAAGLDDRFELLSSGYRTSSRHGSLHAAVSWSYGLLEARLQATFVDLSIFAGSFTVADASAIGGNDERATAADLAQLTERSLLQRTPGRRFVLLETLRAFGAEQLASSGRLDEVGRRHARRQVDWVEGANERIVEPGDSSPLAEIDAALPELRAALGWLLDHGEIALAGRLVRALMLYGFHRLRPDVLAWGERVAAADRDDASPHAPQMWVAAAYTAWMAGDVAGCRERAQHALRVAERRGGGVPCEVAVICGNCDLFEGRSADATSWYRRGIVAASSDRPWRLFASSTLLLPLVYAGDDEAVPEADRVLAEVGDTVSAYAAYAWYCAGEVDLARDVPRARARFARAVELAAQSNASFVTGVAGASKASIDARIGDPVAAAADYRRLIDHWRRAGMWPTQWTMLRSIAGLLERLGRHRDAAVLEGAVRSTDAGHRIFGTDAIALDEMSRRLRAELGDAAYRAALAAGAVLDGDAAVEHALSAL
jgi:predicted ATPase/DNA-binding SARP family transcriptional activator